VKNAGIVIALDLSEKGIDSRRSAPSLLAELMARRLSHPAGRKREPATRPARARAMARIPNEMREALDEPALIRRARGGDRAAFEELVRIHFARIYSFLHRMIGNHEDAEDLAQDCFVRAWRSLAHFRGESAFGAWLARIALHLAHDHHRRNARSTETLPLESVSIEVAGTSRRAGESDTSEVATRGELAGEIRRALDRLPPRLRAALVLRALEGRDYREVAQITGVKIATARAHVMQARKLLLRWLAPSDSSRESGAAKDPKEPEENRP
jgi:RNA polymerase sigma-70 factor (ECF subfamily)